MTDGRPTLMKTTPGYTTKRMSRLPLMTEAEATPGDDQTNPYNSVQEAEATREVERKQEEHQDDQLFVTSFGASDTGGVDNPLQNNSIVDDLQF